MPHRRGSRFCAVAALWLLLAAPLLLPAADLPALTRPSLAIPRLERPPALEDFLDMKPNGAARGLAKVEGFVQRNPSDGRPASQRTDVYLGYDDQNLYAVFVCFDSEPEKIRARMVRREDVF
ncbi:MAG: hypothetical protein ACE5HB_09095, partial [Terriglobia bacterium]